MSRLDSVAKRSISFLFPRCQARLDGKDLVVAVPSPRVSARAGGGDALRWGKPHRLAAGVTVRCEPGPHRRADRSEYPVAQAYPKSVEFRFRGAVWYGRVPLRDGWALCVQGSVRSLRGLPAAFAAGEAVLVETSFAAPEHAPAQGDRIGRVANGGGPVNGPHLPYP